MIKIIDKTNCCGCEACSQICAKQAITMMPDKQGFLYPTVNVDICNNCGLCESICPLLKKYEARKPIHTYAVKNKNEDIRMKSSSGGVFSILAEDTINRGGVVYGAVFDKDWNVIHDRIDTIDGIARLRGSKYVQSRMTGIYSKVKNDLQSGIPVLFSGCHCHIAALHAFLKCKYDNLMTVDVVCGGVPSPRIWQDFLKEELDSINCVDGYSIRNIKFRDKSNGWRNYHFTLDFAKTSSTDNHWTISHSKTSYVWKHTFMLSWLKQFITRPSCHQCHFRCGRCGSDFTIADYWCIEKLHPEFYDDKGVSILLTYNDTIPNCIEDNTTNIETEFMHAANGQTCLLHSHPYNPVSKLFYFLHDLCCLNLNKTLKVSLFVNDFRTSYNSKINIVKAYLYAAINKLCLK